MRFEEYPHAIPSPDDIFLVNHETETSKTTIGEVLDNVWKANGRAGAKNFLQNTATTDTVSGVTFTVNADGSVKANGTATADVTFVLFNTTEESCPYNECILSGCPSDGGSDAYDLRVSDITTSESVDEGEGVVISLAETGKWQAAIVIRNGYSADNLMFYPMIRQAYDTNSTYAPYAMTNKELTDALGGGSGDDITTSTATFTQAGSRANLVSGETAATLFGKIMKWFADLADLAFIAKDGQSSTKYLRGDGTWQTFPTINDATLTILQNGTTKATFTANSSTNATAGIVTDEWTATATVSSGQVSFSGLDDTQGWAYRPYINVTTASTNKNPTAQVSTLSGTGTASMSVTYTTDADEGASVKLRIIK